MKKNISINISGIIFHIEEDGYESLRKYLDSINKYFASYEDSSEIISDIESRIAEIFLTKLNEGKQVITAEDVKSLMVTMGSVTDFKAAEDETAESATSNSSTAQSQTQKEQSYTQSSSSTQASKKLTRDNRRKVLGGVCSGMAHYFNVDPVWVRVLFALLALGSSGFFIVLYIILWIALPETELDDQPSVKKMYRDPEHKVLGRVASGLAAFSGTDVALIRLIFVITAFLGVGFIIYIIFWIALPEAKTITEKMEMQGEPVTLSNIESSVKKSLHEQDRTEESTLAKIILFPFRAIAAVLNAIAKVIGPIFTVFIEAMRIGVGAVITFLGLALMLACIFSFGIMGGVMSGSSFPESWHVQFFSIPVEAFQNTFPVWTVIFGFLAAVIPAIVIFLLGISTIAKKIVFGGMMGWTMFIIFFVSAVFLSFSIPQLVFSFKEEGEVKVEKAYPISSKKLLFKIKETGLDDYDVTNINLKGYDGKELKLVQRFEAQGNNRKVAAENAQMVYYNVDQKDSVFYFDSNITFKPDAKFRAQRMRMDVYIPNNMPFEIEDELWRLIDNYPRYRHDNQTETWKFVDGDMQCLTCPDYSKVDEEDRGARTYGALSLNDQYNLQGFNAVDLSGIMNVKIQQGESWGVDLGKNNELRKRYDVYLSGETLVIEYDDKRKFFWNNKFFSDDDEIEIKITMPNLKEITAKGAGKLSFRGFNESDLDIDLMGALVADGDVDASNMNIDLTGASFLDLKGRGNFIEADITGASGLRAYSFEAERGVISAHGAATAKVNVTQSLEMSSSFASNISYRGSPDVIKRR